MTPDLPSASEAAAAFDAIAADYDTAYGPEGNAVMTWMRAENLALLRGVFASRPHLLELGCGTGEEALALARAGHTILATDLSSRMVAITRAKADAAGVGDRIRTEALAAGSVGTLQPEWPLDGAYASFGGLNCEPELEAVGAALARLLPAEAPLVVSVMGKTCLFEMVWYLLRCQPRRAFRRLARGWQVAPVAGVDGREVSVATRYLSLRDMRRVFSLFRLEQALALPLLLPPPYADAFFRRHSRLYERIPPVERWIRARWPWRALGDHIVLVLRRR